MKHTPVIDLLRGKDQQIYLIEEGRGYTIGQITKQGRADKRMQGIGIGVFRSNYGSWAGLYVYPDAEKEKSARFIRSEISKLQAHIRQIEGHVSDLRDKLFDLYEDVGRSLKESWEREDSALRGAERVYEYDYQDYYTPKVPYASKFSKQYRQFHNQPTR
jgi:hypothetical protein